MPNSISNISIPEYQPSRNELSRDRDILTRKIKSIKNEISTDYDKPIAKKQKVVDSALKTLNKVDKFADEHGGDTVIRLKNGNFKKGDVSGFLNKMMNGSRYQTERQDAAKIANVKGGKASASQLQSTLQEKIANNRNEIAPLKMEKEKLQAKLEQYMPRLSRIQDELRSIAAAESREIKANAGNIKNREDFSTIYQSNAGCKALNAHVRYMNKLSSNPGKLDGKTVVREYSKAHGDLIFTGRNDGLKTSIKSLCSNLSQLVENGSKLWYTPTNKNRITHRGQGMTSDGVIQLVSQFNKDKDSNTSSIYALGQFFSTSTIKSVAQGFANRSRDDVKVMFNINGNSSSGIFAPDGLDFNNDEGEALYSPLANFKVNNIEINKAGIYQVSLQEVPRQKESSFLPY